MTVAVGGDLRRAQEGLALAVRPRGAGVAEELDPQGGVELGRLVERPRDRRRTAGRW